MHPAGSIVLFTSLSGIGYGLLAWMGLLAALGVLPPESELGLIGLAFAFILIVIGLVSSTFHLGHPERAWRALSQWRSSWLSREGVMAIVTFGPALLFAYAWVINGKTDGSAAFFGLLSALAAGITVACTAMIYASLKPIHAWHNSWVLPNYLLLAAMAGLLWCNLLAKLFLLPGSAITWLALIAILLAWAIKHNHWRHIDGSAAKATPESATGLGKLGKVRLLDPPHSQSNYLRQEMGFQIARKHAGKLRRLTLVFAFFLPLALSLLLLGLSGAFAALIAALAAASASLGILIERWLFFAEAKHTVTLYYGAEAA